MRVLACTVLGAFLFIIDHLVVGDVLKEMNLPNHKYADDSQLYIAFNRSLKLTVAMIDKIISLLMDFLGSFGPALNAEKVKLLVISTKSKLNFCPKMCQF